MSGRAALSKKKRETTVRDANPPPSRDLDTRRSVHTTLELYTLIDRYTQHTAAAQQPTPYYSCQQKRSQQQAQQHSASQRTAETQLSARIPIGIVVVVS